jgi:GNAT superfamily N-acetyltransferase
MRQPRLRPMEPTDLDPVVDAIRADDWGDRRSWFAFALATPTCHPIVAMEGDGAIVGTGVATVNGPVAWIGTIWVAPDHRGRGLGRTLTEATIDIADGAGCRTLVLVATNRGRPLYERLGFEVQTWYRTMEAPGLGGDGAPADAAIRPFRPGDVHAMVALDRAATGEDRSAVLAALATPDGTRVLASPADEPVGFVVRAPWGGGATIADDREHALTLVRARRREYPADRRVRCGILLENEAGAAKLEADGWTEAWRAPRLIRGARLDWHPERIWGQFNHALG